MSEVIFIRDSAQLVHGCFVCGAYHWDCTVDGCKPRGGNRNGDVLHCKVCNTAYIVQKSVPHTTRPPVQNDQRDSSTGEPSAW